MATSLPAVSPRTRTARACDQCRRRKTKCDGQPRCKNCMSIGLECSYGNLVKQARGATYVVHLENKLRNLEARLHKTSGSSGASSEDVRPGLDVISRSNSSTSSSPDTSMAILEHESREATGPLFQDQSIDDMVDTINITDNDEGLIVDEAVTLYRGSSTGIEIVKSLYLLCNSFAGFTIDLDNSATKMANALDRSFPSYSLPSNSMTNLCFPSQEQLYRWIDIAFTEAFTLWPFIDRDVFNFQLQRLLQQTNFGQEKNDIDNLALIHAVIALGQRYDKELLNPGGDCFESAKVRGIRHFDIAKELTGWTECSRSVTAVQTLLCICLYLKSGSALRMVHTYVSMASHAAHQLGLHVGARASHRPPRERLVRQRVYITLRMFDAYVTSSLGLPRNIRATQEFEEITSRIPESSSELFRVADANMELLEILGIAIERTYLPFGRDNGSSGVPLQKLQEVGKSLELWEQKHQVSARIANHSLETCTKYQLTLRYSWSFVLMTLYCPFLHHIAKPNVGPIGYACGYRGIEAACEAVRTAKMLKIRDWFHEAYPLTVDVLVIAATTLIVAELGAPKDVVGDMVREASKTAKSLLEDLAKQNNTASQCLESLRPLYQTLHLTTELIQECTLSALFMT